MTATAQCVKPEKQKTSSWTQVFPAATKTQQQSALFVKKLLAVAVSNITYLRAIFPEVAFGDRCLEDLNLKILRDESSCPGACQVIKWMKGCFDALDKKYLKMMVIGIYIDPEKPDTVVESYTFKFSYTDNEGLEIYRNNKKISSSHNDAETKQATIRLLRTIVVLTQSLQALPNDAIMTMKLFYYDEVTPEDYEPPGFKPSTADGFHFEEEPMNIKVGDVSTGFHTMKLRIKTDPRQFEVNEEGEEKAAVVDAAPESQEEAGSALDDGLDESDAVQQPSSVAVLANSNSTQVVPRGPESPDPAEGDIPMEQEANRPSEDAVDTTGSQATGLATQDDNGVRCACGYNEDDGLMILCTECRFWQHGICYQIADESEAPSTHYCDVCTKAGDGRIKPTDQSLSDMDEVALQATCVWRRALHACLSLTRVLPQSLCKQLGVEMTVAQGLVKRLERGGFIVAPAKNKRFGKIVQKDLLMTGLRKYLKRSKVFADKKEMSTEHAMNSLTEKTQALSVTEQQQKQQTGGRRAQKRVKALVDGNEYEFDECDSQDFETESSGNHKRRKRASIAAKPLRI